MSTSPYLSFILFVMKKDDYWRYCVDYMNLNKIIVPNKFPLLVEEKM